MRHVRSLTQNENIGFRQINKLISYDKILTMEYLLVCQMPYDKRMDLDAFLAKYNEEMAIMKRIREEFDSLFASIWNNPINLNGLER